MGVLYCMKIAFIGAGSLQFTKTCVIDLISFPAFKNAEFALMDDFVKARKPVLGICRGHQFINVFFGGSLCQHIPEADLHTGSKAHTVAAEEGSVLKELYGPSFSVNSTHHQAVKKLGDGLRATAFWDDKYVEATEHTSLPIISMQWHPEAMCFDRRRDDTVDGAKIFEHFVTMCKIR